MSQSIWIGILVFHVVGVILLTRIFTLWRTHGRRAGVQLDALRAHVKSLENKLAVIDRETKALQWARWWARNAAESGPHDPMRAIGERVALVALLCDDTDEIARALRIRAPNPANDYQGATERNAFWFAVHRDELECGMRADNLPPWQAGPWDGKPAHNAASIALRRRTLLELDA